MFGDARLLSQNGERQLAPGDTVAQNDTVRTGAASIIDIVYGTSGLIRINENSQVRMTSLSPVKAQTSHEWTWRMEDVRYGLKARKRLQL